MAVLEIARRQHWVISLAQLIETGFAPDSARTLVRRGRLHRVHRGVYAVGRPSLTREGRWMAAVLACGDGALLSHKSSAALWGLVRGDGATTHITLQRRARSRERIEVHTTDTLLTGDTTEVDGIPCTSVARTLLDYAGAATPVQVNRAVTRAEQLRLFDRRATDDVLARSNGRAGAVKLRTAIVAWEEPSFTRSVAERILLELIRASHLPQPLVNQNVAGHEVDLWWPAHAMVAEMDGYEFHGSRHDFERDHEMSLDLGAADIKLVRISWRQLDRPDKLVARLAASLGPPGRGVRVA